MAAMGALEFHKHSCFLYHKALEGSAPIHTSWRFFLLVVYILFFPSLWLLSDTTLWETAVHND